MLKEMITKSVYKTESIGVYDLTKFEEDGVFSHDILIKEIIEQGDRIKSKSNVKAPMTEWNMCLHSQEFQKLGACIIRNGVIPYLGDRFMNLDDIKKQTYILNDMWGAEYRGNGDDFTQSHDHRASFCSFSYYLQTPKGCPPLIFDELDIAIDPTPGMLVCFRGDNKHSVPRAKHEGSRIMIAGNTTIANQEQAMVDMLRNAGYEVNAPVSST